MNFKKWLWAIALLASLGAPMASVAKETIQVCAKYKRASGSWSDGYKVQAHVMSGTELNSATKSFDYTSYSKYAIIFWAEGQASVIEMDYGIIGFMSEGKDKQGRTWELTKGNSYCF